MRQRLVDLSQCAINSVAFSSIFNIGDTGHFNPKFRAIAMQREGNVWNDAYDIHFDDYDIFQRKANWIDKEIPVIQESLHHNDCIKVGRASMTEVSQSSTAQIGSIKKINAEARIKHIRILQDEENNE